MKTGSQLLLISLIAVTLCFFFIWPGVWRYRYYEESYSHSGGLYNVGNERSSGERSLRIDRLTGAVQIYDVRIGNWKRHKVR